MELVECLALMIIVMIIMMLLLIAQDSIKIELKENGKKYKGFISSVLFRIAQTGGISLHFLPFPDVDVYDDPEVRKYQKSKNRKIGVFWLLVAIMILFGLLSEDGLNKTKFDSAGWKEEKEYGVYKNRKRMLYDLVENEKLTGLTYAQLVQKLGYPDSIYVGQARYCIANSYENRSGVFTKFLDFKISKDSVITTFEVVEKKR